MKLKKKYVIIVVPIVLILLLIGYKIENSIKTKPTKNNNVVSSVSKGNNKNISSPSPTSANKITKEPAEQKKTSSSKSTTSSKTLLSHPNTNKVNELIKQLSSEKQVLSSQIYIKDNMHYATITFKNDADGKTAGEFAKKYAKLIKDAYNDKNVNVDIVQNDKTIANEVLK